MFPPFEYQQIMSKAIQKDWLMLETYLSSYVIDWESPIDHDYNTLLHWGAVDCAQTLKLLIDHLPDLQLLNRPPVVKPHLRKEDQRTGQTVLAYWLKTGLDNKKWFAQDPDYLECGHLLIRAGADVESATLQFTSVQGELVSEIGFLDILEQVNGLDKWEALISSSDPIDPHSSKPNLNEKINYRRKTLGSS